MNKTQDLINHLVTDSKASSLQKQFSLKFWTIFFLFFVLSGLSVLYITQNWPEDAHLPLSLSFGYFAEAFLWVLGSLASGWIAYEASFAGPLTQKVVRIAGLILGVAACCILWKWNSLSLASELPLEVDLLRGRCGFFIAFSAVFSSVGLFFVVRGAAPTRLAWAGLWSAASMACVGAFFMHLVCPHDNPLHLIVWHFSPTVGLMLLGAVVGTRALRWS